MREMNIQEERPYASPLREEQLAETRRRILDAGIQVLAKGGPEELTIPRVAQRARVAVRTVYRHFPNKDDLVAAVGHERDHHDPVRRTRSVTTTCHLLTRYAIS